MNNLREQNKQIKSQTDLNKAMTQQAYEIAGKAGSDTVRSWVDTLETRQRIFALVNDVVKKEALGQKFLPWE